MNTTGVQNYLSNVFRPVYIYDTTLSNFTPTLNISNINNFSGNTITVRTAAVGDNNRNMFVGVNAGSPLVTVPGVFDTTVLGFGAGSTISNVVRSVFIGSGAGGGINDSSDVIAIGAGSGSSRGRENIFIGTNTKSTGSRNVLIGHYIDISAASNQVRIGYSNQIPIAADLSRNWVGIGGYTTPVFANENLDVSGDMYIKGAVGIFTQPNVNATLDVNGNFRVDDGRARLLFQTPVNTNASVLSFSNYFGGTATLDISGAIQSSQGFSSIRGTVNTSTTPTSTVLGQIKKGIMHVSVLDVSSTANYAAVTYFAHTTSNVTAMSTAITQGDVSISTSGNNIIIVDSNNTTSIYGYSITYFPLP